MKVKEVFIAGGMPVVTYVDRNHLSLEKTLRTELSEGYKVVAVTGPTKSGKTVLCRKVIPAGKCVWVDGGQIEKSDDFWGAITSSLELPIETTSADQTTIGASLRTIIGLKAQYSEGATHKFGAPSKKDILVAMRELDLTLIVDDFHYLTNELQKDIIRSIKSEIFDGLSVVLIAVPHRAFDTISAEPEMQGRYAHITIPAWSTDDLISIPASGFPKLGMLVPETIQKQLAGESMQSPLLMQRFCGRICINYDITETVMPPREFNPTHETLISIYREVAKQFGFPTFEKLAKGPQSRSKRNPRRLKSKSETLDIYQAILLAIGKTGPKEKIHYNEIRDSLKDILNDADIPQKHEVSNALGHMQTIARSKIKGEPVLEWSSDHLYITDPFLRFFMRWADIKEFSLEV